jgi:hypothetical protein
MSRALLTVVLVACLTAASPVSATASVQVRPLTSSNPTSVSETAEAVSRKQTAAATEPVLVAAASISPGRFNVSPGVVESQPANEDSGWRTYGTLLATLVLMAAIALRRYRVGGV